MSRWYQGRQKKTIILINKNHIHEMNYNLVVNWNVILIDLTSIDLWFILRGGNSGLDLIDTCVVSSPYLESDTRLSTNRMRACASLLTRNTLAESVSVRILPSITTTSRYGDSGLQKGIFQRYFFKKLYF